MRWLDCWAEAIRRLLNVSTETRPNAHQLIDMVTHLRSHSDTRVAGAPLFCSILGSEMPPLSTQAAQESGTALQDFVVPAIDLGYASNYQSQDLLVRRPRKRRFVRQGSLRRAAQPHHDVCPLALHSDAISTISRSLPALLKDCSIKLRHTTTEKMHTDAVSFVRQNRNCISASFRNVIESDLASPGEPAIDIRPLGSSNVVSVWEKVSLWNTESAIDPDPPCGQIFEEEHNSLDAQDHVLSNFLKHRHFLKDSKEYLWLIGKIRAAAALSQSDNNVITGINCKLNLGFNRMKHKELHDPALTYAASFNIPLRLQVLQR
ncbi:MAG: hypothetical protein M1839_004993 [Geoglossum umbratile]|nr:MAG: hypothetical protein M1839_004993 [Geoglossum umbratile]